VSVREQRREWLGATGATRTADRYLCRAGGPGVYGSREAVANFRIATLGRRPLGPPAEEELQDPDGGRKPARPFGPFTSMARCAGSSSEPDKRPPRPMPVRFAVSQPPLVGSTPALGHVSENERTPSEHDTEGGEGARPAHATGNANVAGKARQAHQRHRRKRR